MKLFKRNTEVEAEVVDIQDAQEVNEEVTEKKIDGKKVAKIIGGVIVGVGALAIGAAKVFGKKSDDGYSEISDYSDADEINVPVDTDESTEE